MANFLKLSPFKIGCLTVVLASLIFFSFGGQKPALLTRLDNQVADAMFHWRGKMPSSGAVVIVDLDEKSLRAIGQWPWPRNIVAQLIQKLADHGAKVIGLDITFPESDRTSPKNSLAALRTFLQNRFTAEELLQLGADQKLDHDLALGDTVAETPTVLGYVFQIPDDGLKKESDKPFPSINIAIKPPGLTYDQLTMIKAYRAIVNIPEIAMAQTEGFFNVFPDPAGTVRRVPLFIEHDGIPYPSLGLEMLRLGRQIPQVTIHAAQQSSDNQYSLFGVTLGEQFIPTDNIGQVAINYRGPMKTFPYYSAVDILNNLHADQIKDKYVLIGTSAAGLLDLRATPFSSVFAGVEVHANLIDNILKNDPFRHDIFTEIGLTYTIIILGGLLLSALLAYSSPLIGGLGGMLLIISYLFYGSYHLLFLKNQLVGITYPLATIMAVFLVVTLFNFFFEDRKKRFIQGAFGRYVSPQVVNQLIRSPEKLSLAGEERVVTIFFNDIRGFTTIAEKMSSLELGQFMNEYLTAMSDLIMANKGTVDKYIGDAIMAIWGAPLDDHQHAANALRTSLKMIGKLAELRPGWDKRGLPFIDIGIGLNSGPVSVGNFGSSQRFDYTVLGDNVNLASRLEGLNKMYGTHILLSESSKEAVGAGFFCSFVDLVKVKGKQQPVAIFQPHLEGAPGRELVQEISAFEQAISLYRAQHFGQAKAILATLHRDKPTKLYQLYLDRITTFEKQPPPAEWDGVFTATSK